MESGQKVYWVPTLDVEPLRIEGSSGPPTWAYGEKSVREIDFECAKYGLHFSYFIHPEALVQGGQAPLFKELERKGSILGLHSHPLKWSMFKYQGKRFFKDFGALTAAETREHLGELSDIYKANLGDMPRYFSPGTFSFNDHQYAILDEMGFYGGRCSLPNRVAPAKSAVWAGAELDPHYANGEFRQNKGDLKFVEMPLSVDTSRVLKSGNITHFADLRIDADWGKYGLDYLTIARNIAAQLKERNPEVPVINFVAHNDEDYATKGTRIADNLHQCLEATKQACEELELMLVPATIADIAEKVRASPPRIEKTVLTHGGWMGKEEHV